MSSSQPIRIGAIDLGPSTGRVIVGTIAEGRITLTETRRFTNSAVPLPTRAGERLYWDVLRLWGEIREGLLAAVRDVGPLSAIGVDAWGVDYGLVNGNGVPAGMVSAYNSQRTTGMPERLFSAIPAGELYRINGLQVQEFNTVFQLLAEKLDGGLPTPGNGLPSRTLLLLPDLITCWLTGAMYAEVTNASTTGLVDVRTRSWSRPLVERLRTELGLDLVGVLPETIEAGTVVGPVRRDALEVFGPDGAPTPVVAVGSRDTASAVVAVPATGEDFAYVSCGTWSHVGLELERPVLSEASRRANFSNELGVDGSVRYLKNVMGLWVLNEAVRTWGRQGLDVSLTDLDAAAESSEPLRTVVDLDDPAFLAPGDMAARIDDAAPPHGRRVRAMHQRVPRPGLSEGGAPGRGAVGQAGERPAHRWWGSAQPPPVPVGRRRHRPARRGGPRRGDGAREHRHRGPRRGPHQRRVGAVARPGARLRRDRGVRAGSRRRRGLGRR